MKNRLIVNVILLLLTIDLFAQLATISGTSVEIDNGVISAIIDGGKMTSLNMKGQSNLLANGGVGYFSFNDSEGFHSPSGLAPVVVVNNTQIVDLYYTLTGSFVVEMHYVFKKKESGFYTYVVVEDNGIQYKNLAELRFALRVNEDIMNYGWTVEREGDIVNSEELKNHVEEIQDATYELADGSIYTKYDWSVYRSEDLLHGVMGNGTGLWNIEASREYVNGGPTMQELTLHGTDTSPIVLCYFHSGHYGSAGVYLKREYADWGKIYGPNFIYLNSGTNQEVISDAYAKAQQHENEWPYSWLTNDLYPLDRGELTGGLKMLGNGNVDSAMVFLYKKGPSWVSYDQIWQYQPYAYFFSDVADQNGNFSIKNIRPGTYDLYAYTQKGKLIDDLSINDIIVKAGSNSLDELEWPAGDKQNTIFQVGVADHKSGEFIFGDLPRLYGRWFDTPDYLSLNTSTDNPEDTWYYCQRVNTDYDISFNIDDVEDVVNPTLKVAVAGVDAGPHLDIVLNGTNLKTIDFLSDSGIRRSSLTGGKHSAYTINVDKSLLFEGSNLITMKCYGSSSDYKGIMYDAILFESDILSSTVASTITNRKNILSVQGLRKTVYVKSNIDNTCKLKIYKINGQQLSEADIYRGEHYMTVKNAGIYIVSVMNNKTMHNYKVIVK